MEEIWKDIEGYEGLYQVSNTGKIRSLGRIVEITDKNGRSFKRKYCSKMLKYSTDAKGYFRTCLALNKINTTVKVHRVVAQAFIPNPESKEQINHIDGNKQNNNVTNLEWCTNQENQDHSWKTNLRKKGKEHWSYGKQPKQLAEYNKTHSGKNNPSYGKRGIKNPKSKKIIQYDKNNNFIKQWDSIADAGRELNISTGTVCNCCKGKRKTAYGYIWKYKKEDK